MSSKGKQPLVQTKATTSNPTNTKSHKYPRLHSIVARGRAEKLKKLLEKGQVDVNQRAFDGSTALHHACAKQRLDCVRILLACKDADATLTDKNGYNALHYAAQHRSEQIVALLLAAGVSASATDKLSGGTPLHYAAYSGRSQKVIELLISKGHVSVMCRDGRQQTPLHKAAYQGHTETVYYLLKYWFPDVEAKDNRNMTPIHYAAAQGQLSVLRFLIDKKANTNVRSLNGNTPLHYAALNGHYDCVLSLICAEAIVDSPNRYGTCPLDCAENMGREACSRLLIDEGADVCMRYRTGKYTPSELKTEQPFMSAIRDDAAIDRYGFYMSPKKSRDVAAETSEAVASSSNPTIQQSAAQVERRVVEWVNVAKSSQIWPPPSKRLRKKTHKAILKGIPVKTRGTIWKLMTNVSQSVAKHGENYYEKMLNSGSSYVKQIDLDVARTFRNHSHFCERYGLGQRALFSVLKAYSVHNPEIGYCQGMSQVAGLLLMFLHEEDVFWVLDALMSSSHFGMNDLYVPGFPKLLIYFELLERLIGRYLPDLYQHFQQQDILTSMYATRWFLMVFINQLPFECVLRIWDVFISDGFSFLFASALSLLKIHKDALLSKNFEQIMSYVTTIPDLPLDPDLLIKTADKFTKAGVTIGAITAGLESIAAERQ
mmetsp:Transcript_14536/g.21689  ORF Transcript_14536/g.21689 Transcript_14536/m.21689 type:complete len:656 (+) Transcript_14536:40-2007(+)